LTNYEKKNIQVAVGFQDGTLKVYDTNLALTRTIAAHSSAITRIKYISTLNYVVTCSADNKAKVWDNANSWSLVSTFSSHTGQIQGVEKISETLMATSATDGKIFIWTTATGVQTLQITVAGASPANIVYALQLMPNGDQIAAGAGSTGIITIYNVADGTVRIFRNFVCF
jgi:WD40 repeat protein